MVNEDVRGLAQNQMVISCEYFSGCYLYQGASHLVVVL